MSQVDRLNEVIEYIEDNLENEIDIENLSKIVGCSKYQLVRMFPFIADVSITEYIKKRRLTRAAYDLQNTNIGVTEVCYKYGYNSPTSFSRAFQNLHGVSPSVAKEQGVELNYYLPITFKTIIKGGIEMNYKIVELDEFRAVGLKKCISMEDVEGESNSVEIPQFWAEVMETGQFNNIMALMNKPPFGALGICGERDDESFNYYICASTDVSVPEGMSEVTVSKNTYAVFTCTMDEIQETWKRIMIEWLPSSEYSYGEGFDIEVYPDETSCEIYIPVK